MKHSNAVSFLAVILAIAMTACYVYNHVENSQNKKQSVIVKSVDAIYSANFADDRVLMGAAQNVFVGKVIGQTGTEGSGANLETDFAVQVLFNIKGNLQGVVSVHQVGGYDNGVLYEVSNDQPIQGTQNAGYLLLPGSTYLLATRHSPDIDWYMLNTFPAARKLISDDNNLGSVKLQNLAANDPRVQQLEAAYPNEILLNADVAHNMTLNSYVSTHPVLPPPPPVAPTSTPSVATSSSFTETSSSADFSSASSTASSTTPSTTADSSSSAVAATSSSSY